MAKLIILGSSNAIPSVGSENTHLAIQTKTRTILVDCGANPVVRLEQAGVDYATLTDIILTHFHPDHISGLPLLLMDMWLAGRRESINIYGLDFTLNRVTALIGLYELSSWPDFFAINYYRAPQTDLAVLMNTPEIRVLCSPVKHFLPTIGLRFEFPPEDKIVAYSCDTEPCPQLIPLASGADILLHESSGDEGGHSSSAQAAEVARQAEVDALYLIHYPTGKFYREGLVEEAQTKFPGPVTLARDLMSIDL